MREGGVKRRKYAGGGTWSGHAHAQQDFRRGNAGQNEKYEIRKCRRKRKHMGGKGRGI